MADDAGFLKEMAENPHDASTLAVYHDWLKDGGQDSLAEVLKNLDELVKASLDRHLGLGVYPRKQWLGSAEVIIGWTVAVEWDGVMLPNTSRNIDLH